MDAADKVSKLFEEIVEQQMLDDKRIGMDAMPDLSDAIDFDVMPDSDDVKEAEPHLTEDEKFRFYALTGLANLMLHEAAEIVNKASLRSDS